MDVIKFGQVCDENFHLYRDRKGIGTLKEKPLHLMLKHYFEEDESKHEIRIGKYVADIQRDEGIIEIQTRSFDKLRKKLQVFLESSKVTIVYPVPYIKWIYWINEETGETSEGRKSPKKGSPYLIFHELYKIKEFLCHPNLSLCIILINMDEYKLLNGWSYNKKRGATRYDRIPLELIDEIYINRLKDYAKLIPETLENSFTSKDYQKASKLSLSAAQKALNILFHVKAVRRVDKIGNSYVYERENLSENL